MPSSRHILYAYTVLLVNLLARVLGTACVYAGVVLHSANVLLLDPHARTLHKLLFVYLGCDAPSLVPVKSFLVNQKAHELSHRNGGMSVIHLKARFGGKVLPVLVSSLLVPSHHILQGRPATVCLRPGH